MPRGVYDRSKAKARKKTKQKKMLRAAVVQTSAGLFSIRKYDDDMITFDLVRNGEESVTFSVTKGEAEEIARGLYYAA